MKKARSITRTLTLLAPFFLVACDDLPFGSDDQKSEASSQFQQVGATALQEAVTKLLEAYPQVELVADGNKIQPAVIEQDGSQLILAEVPVRVRERLLQLEETPSVLNELRKASNEAINNSVRPDSGYLIQAGAPTSVLIDEDRQAKPLPPELDSIAKQLKSLAEESVYVVTYEQDAIIPLEAKIRLVQSPNKVWVISDLDIDDRPLIALKDSVRVTAQDGKHTILTPEWLEKRKAAISTLCEQFKQLSTPYIAQREEMARKLLVERISNYEEQRLAVIEKATQQEQARLARKLHIANSLQSGGNYTGEWTRDTQFGKLTLQIDKAELLDESIQFVGAIFDTDLPEARLDVAGRFDLAQPDGNVPVSITIYDGQYDPDQPTAEVYDAKDGALSLELNEKNQLVGIMNCLSWGKDSERNFTVKLSPSITSSDEASEAAGE